MQSPTNHVVVTKEGLERKQMRLVFRALKAQYPMIFDQLLADANYVIDFDQANPHSTVTGSSAQTPSPVYRAVGRMKRLEQKEAIVQRYRPSILPLNFNFTISKDE
jgi:hypothetical protein